MLDASLNFFQVGENPLHLAAIQNSKRSTEILIDLTSDINAWHQSNSLDPRVGAFWMVCDECSDIRCASAA